jgi:hypothetical protein
LANKSIWQRIDRSKAGGGKGIAFSPDGASLATQCEHVRPPAIRLWDVSQRPGGGGGRSASLPRAYPDLITQDDLLLATIEGKIRGTFSQNIEELKLEMLPDGTIKLTGKVSDSETKRVAQLDAETLHAADDSGPQPRNKVINELEVTGRYRAR